LLALRVGPRMVSFGCVLQLRHIFRDVADQATDLPQGFRTKD
jgi:hypothetical protein